MKLQILSLGGLSFLSETLEGKQKPRASPGNMRCEGSVGQSQKGR